MKLKRSSLGSLICCAGAALALAAAAPQDASAAATAANAKILNIVTVTYYDATGANSHTAATSSSVIVALKQAPLTVATRVAFPAVDSGVKTTSFVELTSNANGSDSYTVNFTNTAVNLSNDTITTKIAKDTTDAAPVAITSGQTVTLGATSIVSVAAASGGSQDIKIPGGALNGISTTSIVVIGGVSYKVTAVDGGSLASYQTGPQTGTDTNAKTEVLGTITITTDPNGSNVAPNLTTGATLAGTIIGERKYLKIEDTGIVSSNIANGTDTYSITTDTSTNSGGAYATGAVTDVATFYFVSVRINKTVTNVTTGLSNGSGKPGDVLEYTVTVENTSANGNAGKVSIADAVPAYTTLISGASALGTTVGTGASTEKFATVNDGTNPTVDITLDPTDNESTGVNAVGNGGTTGNATIAGTPITFYLGTNSNGSTGGTVAATKTYTVKYRVKIN